MHKAPQDLEAVFALLRSPSPQKRVVALVQAAERRMEAVAGAAIEALRDEDPDVRATAAWLLDRLGVSEAIEPLLGALYDRVFAVRMAAGWGLLHLAQSGHADEVMGHMADVLHSTRNVDARETARLVLVHLANARANALLDEAPFTPVLH